MPTISEFLLRTVDARAGQVALRWKRGDAHATWTWSDYAARVARLAAALGELGGPGGERGGRRVARLAAARRELGVQRGDRVVLMMRNRPEFHVADTAAVVLGATPISIYNSSAPEQVQY